MRDKSTQPSLEPGFYRHFKGGTYEAFAVVSDRSEGCEDEWKVLYWEASVTPQQSILQGFALAALERRLYVRKYEEFVGVVFRDGESKKRFEKVADEG